MKQQKLFQKRFPKAKSSCLTLRNSALQAVYSEVGLDEGRDYIDEHLVECVKGGGLLALRQRAGECVPVKNHDGSTSFRLGPSIFELYSIEACTFEQSIGLIEAFECFSCPSATWRKMLWSEKKDWGDPVVREESEAAVQNLLIDIRSRHEIAISQVLHGCLEIRKIDDKGNWKEEVKRALEFNKHTFGVSYDPGAFRDYVRTFSEHKMAWIWG